MLCFVAILKRDNENMKEQAIAQKDEKQENNLQNERTLKLLKTR